MKKDKILIFGRGFIGDRLQKALQCRITEKMILKFEDADQEIARFLPDVIINCIGYTGAKNVDGCELDKDATLSANVFVPLLLAEVALRRSIKLVHISSGCIYNYDYSKNKPITERDIPDFFGLFYSRSKIYAERALDVLSSKYNILIARIRIPLDDRPSLRNILDKIIRYKKVIDLPNSVTYIPDLIKALEHLIKIDARGIYNVVNSGGLTYPALLDVYKKYRPDFEYEVISYKKLNLVRTNLILSTRKLEKTGFNVRPIKEVYEECVQNYLKY
ncbi:MAG: sugar nucleotide-binding protein [Candidatus Omnitrophota bacterium]